MKSFYTKTEKGVVLFDHFSRTKIFHGSFSRQGGASSPPWDSLNVGYNCGDDKLKVQYNRKKLKELLPIKILVSVNQVHGKEVFIVDKTNPADFEILEGYDALITDIPGVGLMIQQADCQAVMLYDPVREAVGIAHVGWRGSVVNILQKTIRAMVDVYGSRPAEMQAAISPSLGPCCAEFKNYLEELPPQFYSYQVRPEYFDFWSISRDQLCESGLMESRIAIACICTACSGEYFSYRREKITGRSASVIGLRIPRVFKN